MSKKDNPLPGIPGGYVRLEDCRRQHQKIDLALFGADGRGGLVKDIADIKGDVKRCSNYVEKQEKEEQEEKRDYRGFMYSLVGGAIVAVFSYILSLFG